MAPRSKSSRDAHLGGNKSDRRFLRLRRSSAERKKKAHGSKTENERRDASAPARAGMRPSPLIRRRDSVPATVSSLLPVQATFRSAPPLSPPSLPIGATRARTGSGRRPAPRSFVWARTDSPGTNRVQLPKQNPQACAEAQGARRDGSRRESNAHRAGVDQRDLARIRRVPESAGRPRPFWHRKPDPR